MSIAGNPHVSESRQQPGRFPQAVSRFLFTAVFTGGLVCFVLVLAVVRYGSFAAVRAMASGRSVFLEDDMIDLGEVSPDEIHVVHVPLQNISGDPILITGGTTSCGCAVVTKSFPMEIGSLERATIPVRLASPGSGETFDVTVTLFTSNVDEQPTVTLRGRSAVVAGDPVSLVAIPVPDGSVPPGDSVPVFE
ncbi:MAG: DUF1573 domain-containing protein [Planctomycetaceae bacterium]